MNPLTVGTSASARAQPAVLLAFDTSTEQLAVALTDAVGGVHCVHAEGGAAASAALLPQVHGLLKQARLTLQQLQAVAFGAGPGAFTGLRTACAVAQGLGMGLGVPLLVMDSLLIVAEDARLQSLANNPRSAHADWEVAVAVDARMAEVYAARYRWCPTPLGGQWQVLQAPALMSQETLRQSWQNLPLPVVAGSALQAASFDCSWLPASERMPTELHRAQALMALASRAWAAGEGVAAAAALPTYLRDKVAQTTAERLAARDAAPTRSGAA